MDPVIRLIFLKLCSHLVSAIYVIIQSLPTSYRMKFKSYSDIQNISQFGLKFYFQTSPCSLLTQYQRSSSPPWACVPHLQCSSSFSSSNPMIFKGSLWLPPLLWNLPWWFLCLLWSCLHHSRWLLKSHYYVLLLN